MIVGWFSIFCRNDGEGEKRNECFLYSGVTVDEKITEFKQADDFSMAGCVCSLQVTVIGNGIFFQIGKKEERIRRIIQAGWFVLSFMLVFFFFAKNFKFFYLK